MAEVKLTLPEDVKDKVEYEVSEKTGMSRVTVINSKTKVQYVGSITEQDTLDMVVDILLYTAKF